MNAVINSVVTLMSLTVFIMGSSIITHQPNKCWMTLQHAVLCGDVHFGEASFQNAFGFGF